MMKPDSFASDGTSTDDPIAIIGIGCRFPGGSDSPRAFWELMAEGRDGITEVPEDRWNVDRFWDPDPRKPGKMYVKAGGFLRQRIDQFDALFFGMSPREAEYLDPQQRILLEVTWEAFEDAGMPAETLAGSNTGVYIGGFMLDNMLTQLNPNSRPLIGTHTAVSFTLSILANRLSYVFDLRGPNIAMDTACSSSMVAIHQACQALRRNECALAVAGGVNIMHRPEIPIAMCKGGFLSKDGRCKSFDARADGYGRGEGAGIVVLKPFSAALRDEDDIYAVIRGSGVNQDGRTNGITVPNPESQEGLVRRVCREARVNPGNIRYFEAHGTGTAVGDPLEARALGAVVGRERDPGNPCIVGSVKANIGHLEAASGVAGVIKAALCLKHRQIPPLANLETPNPAIPFEELGLRLPSGLEAMPSGTGPALVGVNSFGYGGTNAHAIIEEAPAPVSKSAGNDDTGPWILPISARSPKALTALAAAYRERVAEDDDLKLRDLCYSAGVRRSHHDLRCAVVASTRDEFLERLSAVAEGTPVPGAVQGDCAAKGEKPVFVFTGMGPQWWAMGRELYERDAEFRRTASAVDEIFRQQAGWSILEEMQADEASSRMSETQVAQPANFLIQAGLAAMWRARGIEPAAVVGHSVGEVSAAYVAGVLSLEDAVKVSFHRSRIQRKAAGLGTMLAVGVGEAEAWSLLQGYEERVSIAAANSPSATTLAGDRDALEAIAGELERKGVFNRFLRVEVAYHSPYMDPLRPELLSALADLRPKAPAMPLYSTVTGAAVTGIAYDAEYWYRNVREPVYFAKAIDKLLADGHRLFLEVGPHPVLSTSIKECARAAGLLGSTAASLRRGEPEMLQFLTALGELYAAGSPLDWRKLSPAGSRFVKLPTYPWQRETYWHESEVSLTDRLARCTHPLLGLPIDGPEQAWGQALNANDLPYLPDHQVDGLVVLPGAAYVELGFAVRTETGLGAEGTVEDLHFAKALVIGDGEEPEVRTVYHAENREYRVYSRGGEGHPWTLHAGGRLAESSPGGSLPQLDIQAIKARCIEYRDGALHYRNMHTRGLRYGAWFQGVRELYLNADASEVLAHIEHGEPENGKRPAARLDPTLLDACFQTLLALLDGSDRRVYVPVTIDRVVLRREPGDRIWCHGRRTGGGPDTVVGDLKLCDEAGNVVAEVRGVRAQALNRSEQGVDANLDNWFYEYGWLPSETGSYDTAPAGRWLVLLDQHGVGERIARTLRAGDAEILRVHRGDGFAMLADGSLRVPPDDRTEIARLLQAVDPAGLSGILCLWGLDANDVSDPVGIETAAGGLHLIQALAEMPWAGAVPLFLVTRGAQLVLPNETETALGQSPLVGLMRVAVNEYPGQRFRAVDLDPTDDSLALLVRELASMDDEEEIAYRKGIRYVRRLNKISGTDLAAAAPARLFDTNVFEPMAGEVAIAVRGCSHLYPEGARPARSAEPADRVITGIVTATGPDIPRLAAGDTVLAVYRGEPAQSLILPAASVFPLAPMSDDELGSFASQVMPLVTAHYALHHLARVSAGERVLIHPAAGSSGLAAVKLALALGAEVFATGAGSDRELIRHSAVRVIDADAADFEEQILDRTIGQGVDVAFGVFEGGEARNIAKLLAPLGRIISTVDRAGEPLPMEIPVAPNRSVFTVCPGALRTQRPELFTELAREVQALLKKGVYTPITVPEAGQLAPAVPRAVVGRSQNSRLPLRPDGTYLITGGFGGFGMEIAQWLAKNGVRHLVLVGRRGAAGDEAKALVSRLERTGVSVHAAAADIARETEVAALLEHIAGHMPPLRGVFHAAAVLDDSPLARCNPTRIAAVMRPKALGAWHLHRHTRDLPLDLFVLFSSISALIGNPGQGAYVAANAVLDAMAQVRRAQGLPAASINWGALSEVGMVAQRNEVEEYFNRVGIGFFNPAQALEVLGRLIEWNPPQVGAAVIDSRLWGRFNPAWAASPRYRHLIEDAQGQAAGGSSHPLIAALSELPGAQHGDYVTGVLVGIISEIMRIPIEKIDRRQSLSNLGIDSLMAMELQTVIGQKTGARLSTLELMKGTPIEQLGAQVLAFLQSAAQPAAESPAPSPDVGKRPAEATPTEDTAAILGHLDDLSEEEIDAMLASLMKI